MNKIYAGIGSRDAPDDILEECIRIAITLAKKGFTLRSGGAEGCDDAFEIGCDHANGSKEIYLPWKKFNRNSSELYTPSDLAFEIAEKYHPKWNDLRHNIKKLHARNTHQILGQDCCTPVDFVVCFTPKGELIGGTSQALRIARDYDIPILNLGSEEWKIQQFTLLLDLLLD